MISTFGEGRVESQRDQTPCRSSPAALMLPGLALPGSECLLQPLPGFLVLSSIILRRLAVEGRGEDHQMASSMRG